MTLAVLGVLGLLLRHAWWTTLPLSAGDWQWWGPGRLHQWFPWPTIWDQTLGFGGQNRFEDAFRYPVYALSGVVGFLGGSWTVAEKLVYFLPYAVLLPTAGWLFAREVMGRTRWALLAPLLLLGSSYLMLEANVHVPLTIAEAVGLLALTAFLRAMRRRSIAWAIGVGLLLAVSMVFDARPVYLTGLMMALYIVVLALADLNWRRTLHRILLAGLAAAVFGISQAYWLLPLLAYGHTPHLPTPPEPNFNVVTLDHGISGVSDFWTGGAEALLVEAPLNPAFMILPLLAFIPLLRRRVAPEVLWLVLAAVIAAFMAKTDNPPLGALYDWMYVHIPGWRLFREGSKFLYIVVAAYSVLVPMALQQLATRALSVRVRWRLTARAAAAIPLLGVVALCVASLVVLESGVLDSTTNPTAEPASFVQLTQMLDADAHPGAVMWFGEPVVLGSLDRNHRFVVASAAHSIAYMTGTLTEDQVHHRDLFQYFCANSSLPYCYLSSGVFQYLAQLNGATYAIAPGGNGTGVLPNGISREWLREQLSTMYGSPQTLGTGADSLLVWHLGTAGPIVRTSAAVAVVDSGPWSLPQTLPALQALGIPAVYRQTLDSADYPAAPASLPDAVLVSPRIDGACQLQTSGSTALFVQSTSSTVEATVGGQALLLHQLASPAAAPGWGVFGPIQASSGTVDIVTPNATAGPCIGWSGLAASVLGSGSTNVATAQIGSQGERIVAPLPGTLGAWTELDRSYDPGWHLGGAAPTAVGDGLLNLYYTAPGAKAAKGVHNGSLVFEFSTLTAERVGEGVAGLGVLAAVVLLILARRRERRTSVDRSIVAEPVIPEFESRVAPYFAGVALVMLAVAALASASEWLGLPSRFAAIALSSDPYRLDVGYDAAAIVLVVIAVTVACFEGLLPRRRATVREVRRPASLVAVSLLCIGVVLVLGACDSVAPSDPSVALQEAQQAGATSVDIAAASLADARVQRQAHDANACIADYTEALSGFPTLESAYAGRADCYMSSGADAPAAVHDYTRAIDLSPENPGLHLRRAAAEAASGDVQSAAADYLRAASIPSATQDEFLVAVDGLISLQQYADARTALDQGRADFPNSGVVDIAAASLDIALSADADALAEYQVAEPLLPSGSERARLFADLCSFDVFRHEYPQALSDCRESTQFTTAGAGAYDDMSVADLALGNIRAGIADLTSAIDAFSANVNPEAQPSGVDGFGFALLLEARAKAEVEAQMIPAAIADFNQALNALPTGTPDLSARLKGELESIT